jgi:hypothetical protein
MTDQQAPSPGRAVDAREELRRHREAQGIDEEREHEPLEAPINGDADLPDRQRRDERARDTAELEMGPL